jgi:hypothetical protein
MHFTCINSFDDDYVDDDDAEEDNELEEIGEYAFEESQLSRKKRKDNYSKVEDTCLVQA